MSSFLKKLNKRHKYDLLSLYFFSTDILDEKFDGVFLVVTLRSGVSGKARNVHI